MTYNKNTLPIIAVSLIGITAIILFQIYQNINKLNIPDIDYDESWKDQ